MIGDFFTSDHRAGRDDGPKQDDIPFTQRSPKKRSESRSASHHRRQVTGQLFGRDHRDLFTTVPEDGRQRGGIGQCQARMPRTEHIVPVEDVAGQDSLRILGRMIDIRDLEGRAHRRDIVVNVLAETSDGTSRAIQQAISASMTGLT